MARITDRRRCSSAVPLMLFALPALLALAACAVGCAAGEDSGGGGETLDGGVAGGDAGTSNIVDDAGPSAVEDTSAPATSDDSGGTVVVREAGEDSEPTPSPSDAGVGGGPPDATTTLDASPPPVDAGQPSPADAGPVDAGPITATLLGKWTFDEGTGTSSADLSGNGHPATFVGGASWAAAGKEGTGLALDGATGYADTGVTLIDTSQSFSVLAWIKLNQVNAWEIAASQDDVNGSLFGLKLRGDSTDAFDFDIETNDSTSPGFVVSQSVTTAASQTWYHLAGVYNSASGGTLKIYVNGALQANAAVQQAVLASTGHFVMGRGLFSGAKGSWLNGTIDEVEVYGGPLSDAQVSAVYTAQE
jgi:hypothetical protein